MIRRINQFTLLLGLTFILICSIRTISTPEFWSHLAQAEQGTHLSWIQSEATPHIPHLYDSLLNTFWKIGGASLVTLLNSLALLISFGLLIRVAAPWGNFLSQSFALLISGHLIFHSIEVGPVSVMVLFIALFSYILTYVKKQKLLYASLLVLQILWAQIHASFLFGPVLVAAAAIAQSKSKPSRIKQGSINLVYLIPLLLIVSLFHPAGANIYSHISDIITAPNPIYWFSIMSDFFEVESVKPILLFVIILSAAGLVTLKKNLPLYHTILAVLGIALLWTSPKMSLQFVALGYPFLVLSIQSVGVYAVKLLPSDSKSNKRVLIAQAVSLAVFIISVIPVVTNKAYIKNGSASIFGLGIITDLYPVNLSEVITHPDFPERIINQPADGGYLSYTYNKRCFIDYRSGIYDENIRTDLNKLLQGDSAAFDQFYEMYRPEAFILNCLYPASTQGIATLVQRDWRLVYFDGSTAVLIINRPDYESIFSLSHIQQSGLKKLEDHRRAFVEAPYQNGNPVTLIGAAKIYLALNRATEAESLFRLLLQEEYMMPGALIGLGNAQLIQGNFDEAFLTLQQAVETYPTRLACWLSYEMACRLTNNDEQQARANENIEILTANYNEVAADKDN
ncbi:MAG: tetratricopeptide repeat protein [Pontiellaceae bacterium]